MKLVVSVGSYERILYGLDVDVDLKVCHPVPPRPR